MYFVINGFSNFLVLFFLGLIWNSSNSYAQQTDSVWLRNIYNCALYNGKAYDDLKSLCKDVGPRLSGSTQAKMAVEWSFQKMKSYGFDRVYLQEVQVPHWVRGNKESAYIKLRNGIISKINVLALGGSIGTNGALTAKVVVFNTLEELKNATSSTVKGKIVFINQKMDEATISTFKSYGACYPIRGDGAIEAAKLGAHAVIIRSLSLKVDEHPHTGSTHYLDNVTAIPAVAISTEDAEYLSELSLKNEVEIVLDLNCQRLPDEKSFNVIAELKGKTDRVITFGGHLDSWDTGEGAHDDGAGLMHCLEALRILKELKYQPENTLRLVFFMNEENGNMGGKTYAKWTKENNENQIAAIESDRGGFSPQGFHCDGSTDQINFLKSLQSLLEPYELRDFQKGYGGVDIGPLKEYYPNIPLYSLVPDSQRYFDFHHAASDVFESVNKRELELGCAAMASFIYLLDGHL